MAAGLLGAICFVAVVLRIAYAAQAEGSQGWGNQVLTNANLAWNISQSRGYTVTLAETYINVPAEPGSTFDWTDVRDAAPAPAARPIAYYLPGYPYLTAAVWLVTGRDGYGSAQVFQSLLDGVIGCLTLFAILTVAGYARAGLIASAAYALAAPAVIQSALVLPDSLSNAANLLVVAAVVMGFALRRPLIGAATAGALLGAGNWLRGDALLLLPFVIGAVLVRGPIARRQRPVWAGVFVVAWAVPTLLLAGFFQHTYGEFHLTRPGGGILLWESIGQQENPWGITAPEGGILDQAAADLVGAAGLPYGFWASDAFLRDEALDHMLEQPGWFMLPTLKRFVRVTTFGQPPEADSGLSGRVQTARSILGPVALVVAAAGLVVMRRSSLAGILLAVWLSRVVPFSFLRDELRFEILLVSVYIALGAVVVDGLISLFERRYITRTPGAKPGPQRRQS